MLSRKIEPQIRDWATNKKNALLIDGARQVGKTFVIRKVLEDEKIPYIEFNLVKTPEIKSILEKSISADEMTASLSLFTDKKFEKGKTFIFFDEIQEFENLVTKIKFWVDDGSYRYVLSGSLLGVALKNLNSAPVGYLETKSMYPLDFEEFLQVYNFSPELKKQLNESYRNKTRINESVHNQMMKIFHMYLNVGGMPAAVDKFRETQNLEDVIQIHEDIILQYKKDFTKYETDDKKLFISQVYDLIPAELNSNSKRFNYSDIKKGLRFERSENNFLWLANAGVALPVYNVEEPKSPFQINELRNLFKLFLADVGMLTTMYGRSVKRNLVLEQGNINYGAIYENIATQELKAHGFKLHYFNNKKMGELDFIVEYNGKVLPIEIKSGKDYERHSALNNVLGNEDFGIKQAIVFSSYNVKSEGKITYYPIYMLMFLENEDIELPAVSLAEISF